MIKFLTNVSLSLFSTFITLILGIIAVEAIFYGADLEGIRTHHWPAPHLEFDSELGWRQIRKQCIKNEWGSICSNSEGFRSAEVDSSKDAILIIGDSVAWGYGVGDEESAPALIEQKLKTSKYQVHNMGVTGYGIDQTYLNLMRHQHLFDRIAHIVLVIYAPNDLYDVYTNAAYGKRKPYFERQGEDLVLTNPNLTKYDIVNLLSMSSLVSKATQKWESVDAIVKRIANIKEVSFEEALEVSAILIKKINQIAEQKNAAFSIVLSPMVYDFEIKSDHYQMFEDFCKAHDYTCFDFRRFVLEQARVPAPKLYYDVHHYNEEGNKLLARAIYDYLLRPRMAMDLQG